MLVPQPMACPVRRFFVTWTQFGEADEKCQPESFATVHPVYGRAGIYLAQSRKQKKLNHG
jgi:hypothetical protein